MHKVNLIRHIKVIVVLICLCLGVVTIYISLNKNYLPKPYGYEKIELPNHAYTTLDSKYPYAFEVSKYAIIVDEDSRKYSPYCITIKYPQLHAEIQITYKNFKGNKNELRELIKSSKSLAYMHQLKAHEIKESLLELQNSALVAVIELSGEVPTPMQFYTTDLQKHFIRGAIYFQSSTQNDYLNPIINFIKADMYHLINTLKWKN